MFLNYNIIFTVIGLFIGCLFLSFYYGFRYASLHDFIRIAKINSDENKEDINIEDTDEIRVIQIYSDKNDKEVICILNYKYKEYANLIDDILNDKKGE